MKQRPFKNPLVLREMVVLRLQGWPIRHLAYKYHCEHTSILRACKRVGVPDSIQLLPAPSIKFERVLTDWTGERMNKGKSYAEYLKGMKDRKMHRTFMTNRTSI